MAMLRLIRHLVPDFIHASCNGTLARKPFPTPRVPLQETYTFLAKRPDLIGIIQHVMKKIYS